MCSGPRLARPSRHTASSGPDDSHRTHSSRGLDAPLPTLRRRCPGRLRAGPGLRGRALRARPYWLARERLRDETGPDRPAGRRASVSGPGRRSTRTRSPFPARRGWGVQVRIVSRGPPRDGVRPCRRVRAAADRPASAAGARGCSARTVVSASAVPPWRGSRRVSARPPAPSDSLPPVAARSAQHLARALDPASGSPRVTAGLGSARARRRPAARPCAAPRAAEPRPWPAPACRGRRPPSPPPLLLLEAGDAPVAIASRPARRRTSRCAGVSLSNAARRITIVSGRAQRTTFAVSRAPRAS